MICTTSYSLFRETRLVGFSLSGSHALNETLVFRFPTMQRNA